MKRGQNTLLFSKKSGAEKSVEKRATSGGHGGDGSTVEQNMQLLEDFYRQVEASPGFIKRKKGANYRLGHPFGSNKVSTDPRDIGKRLSDVKKR